MENTPSRMSYTLTMQPRRSQVKPLLLACLSTLGALSACAGKPVRPTVVKDITVTEAVALIAKDRSGLTILDVRTPEEYHEGHIAGAMNLDFKSANFQDRLANLSRERTYLVHCGSGGRSGPTVKMMEKLGFTKILHMEAGYNSWIGEGRPVVGPPPLENVEPGIR